MPLPYRINQEIVEISIIPNNINFVKEIILDTSKQYNIIEEPEKQRIILLIILYNSLMLQSLIS